MYTCRESNLPMLCGSERSPSKQLRTVLHRGHSHPPLTSEGPKGVHAVTPAGLLSQVPSFSVIHSPDGCDSAQVPEAVPGVRIPMQDADGQTDVLNTRTLCPERKDRCLGEGKATAQTQNPDLEIQDRFPERRPSGEWALGQ